MSYTSEFLKYQKGRSKTGDSYTDEFIKLQNEKWQNDNNYGTGLFKNNELANDGFDWTDILFGALGTVADTGVGVVQGAGNLLEGLTDLGTYGVAGIADLFGAGDFADQARDLADDNTIDSLAEALRDNTGISRSTYLGDLGRGVTQGLGQIAGIAATAGIGGAAGLGAKGLSALTTGLMGASSMGSGMSEAYQGGASDGEAWGYGLMKGVVDAGSELIFGGLGKGINALGFGKGLSSLDDVVAKKLSSKISNKFFSNLTEYGVKATAEGLEEVLAGLGTIAAKKLSYMSEEDFGKLWADEKLLDQFISGIIVSGIAQGGDFYRSAKNGTDFITGLTSDEQRVVDKEAEKRITEAEKDGQKLSGKDKRAIYERVSKDLDKGYISIDTIEEVLGKNSAFDIAKNSRLSESYNERARRGQKFTADLSKYNAKQKAIVQKAIDSKILNNTNRSHEFVDLIAKLSADKNVPFDFANNDKIKKSGYAIEGMTVDGYVNQDGITINIDSPKALNFVAGHEITHIMEGTGLYDTLRESVFSYAKSKGDYQNRYDSVVSRYGEGTDYEAELTADLVGEYLFTDADFVNHLSTSNRNLFQKIYDEIKYLCKIATAGSKEARQLEKVKKAFEEAYRSTSQTNREMKYSLSETTDGRFVAVVDSDILSNIDTNSWDNAKKNEVRKAASNALKQFSDGIVVDGITRKVNRTSRKEYTRSQDTEYLYKNSPDIFADKMRAADIADDIVVATTNWNRDGNLKHLRSDHFVDFDHGEILIASGNAKYSAEVVVGITDKGEAVFYDVVDMTPTTFKIKKAEPSTTATTQNAIGDINEDSADNSIPQNAQNVNSENSLSFKDSEISAKYSGYNVYGEDVKLEGISDDSAEGTANDNPQSFDQANFSEHTAPMTAEDAASMQHDILNSLDDSDAPIESTEPKTIKTVRERLEAKLDALETELSNDIELRQKSRTDYDEEIASKQAEYDSKRNKNTQRANDLLRSIERLKRLKATNDAKYEKRISDLQERVSSVREELRTGESPSEQSAMRKELHQSKIDAIKAEFSSKGKDFDNVLKKAKNLSTISTVDNTPQRVMEKALGYDEGQILSDLTVNKVAQNETEGIKWLNSFTDRKNGLLAQLSKQYNIKPGSKESAAAQMYAEGFFVDNQNNIVQYKDAELAKDFPNLKTQANIKGLARDPRIRQIYDETLNMINESRERNGYPAIQRLENYFLHFRAMSDTFSKLGLPFNPNDIKAKDLPTDINGITADLKPGQPYFASANHRKGMRTSFDLLGGLESYLSSAKNQIYHIDDIQTLRALRNYIADTFGQANGLEGLDALSEEEAQEKIKQVYGSHLSTFAKFLNEEANVLAGKTALIDRGLEGIIGRRGITFINTVNKQVGSNMVGLNVSSSLTNFLAGVQAIAKTNKVSCIKSLAQTVSNRISSLVGKETDGFAENNPTVIRRRGAERFYRTPFQKVGDAGYVLMSAVDDITTEFIVRAKYDEFIKKGMSEQQAITEADKWTSRLMGDRSLGQMPQLYNSKMLGLITKFQLEVRNQLDSQFYDTIQETKASNETIKNSLERNAKTAAKVTSTFFQLAVLQHLFGAAFESVAGYNPAFDIIDVLIKTFGFDDEEGDEDTFLDNIEEGFLTLLDDLPYTSTFTGGRIPIASALPIEELIKGVDSYGNKKSRLETIGEALPYYLLPTGFGQIKKTVKGLSMFDDDLPIAGSYTDSGNLRFPIEDDLWSKIQAGVFGQWSSGNARDYFDNERAPLKEKQIQEFIDLDIPIQEYWEYREGLSGLQTLAEKADYINSLDLPVEKKNLLINNISGRKEPIDMTDYGNYDDFEEFDYAQNNPSKYALSQAVGGYDAYKKYSEELNDIKSDKDKNGNTVSGSRKKKVVEYINGLDAEYGEKIILFKSQYPSDDTYNYDIVEYLNNKQGLSYNDIETILKELGFDVDSEGNISWD